MCVRVRAYIHMRVRVREVVILTERGCECACVRVYLKMYKCGFKYLYP